MNIVIFMVQPPRRVDVTVTKSNGEKEGQVANNFVGRSILFPMVP